MPIDFITSEEDGFEKNWIFPYMNIPTNSIESELEERLGNKRATKSTSNAFYTSNQHKPDRPIALLAETDRYLSDNSVNRIIDLSLPRKK